MGGCLGSQSHALAVPLGSPGLNRLLAAPLLPIAVFALLDLISCLSEWNAFEILTGHKAQADKQGAVRALDMFLLDRLRLKVL